MNNNTNKVAVIGSWLIKADRKSVYAIISNWERFPEYFPNIARSINIIQREGNTLTIDTEAGSFGKLFPTVKIRVVAELLPDHGYRCSTHNVTFNTTGEEQLLLFDDPAGTRIEYTYFVTVKNKLFRPIFTWLTNTFGLPYWKKCFVDRLEILTKRNENG